MYAAAERPDCPEQEEQGGRKHDQVEYPEKTKLIFQAERRADQGVCNQKENNGKDKGSPEPEQHAQGVNAISAIGFMLVDLGDRINCSDQKRGSNG